MEIEEKWIEVGSVNSICVITIMEHNTEENTNETKTQLKLRRLATLLLIGSTYLRMHEGVFVVKLW